MDRPVKKPDTQAMQWLVSPSETFERFVGSPRSRMLEGMDLLKQLEGVARASLDGDLKKHATAEARASAGTSVPSTSPAGISNSTPLSRTLPVDPGYSTKQTAYQPALKDPGVVDALLEFHRKNASPPIAPRMGKGAGKGTEKSGVSAGPSPKTRGFQPSAAPRVEISPKAANARNPSDWTRAPSSRVGRVFRPGDGSGRT